MPDAASMDAGQDPGRDAATRCARDRDCDDALFCTAHVCDPAASQADARGCVEVDGPCGAGVCNEAAGRCETCETPDVDGDGVDSVACGGSDCDDADANRYPGNTEVCDTAAHDEDCDPETFGPTDLDGDGQVSSVCCNGADCGPDCNDADPLVPALDEACNGEDDDCDGRTDEGFGCAIGTEIPCEACGAAATRACLSDCSDYGACGREAETCNYCDDTGDGLVADERGLAVDQRIELDCSATELVRLGAARCQDSRLVAWLLADGEVAGAFAQRFTLGHGTAEVRSAMQYYKYAHRDPGAQWSLTVFRATATDPAPDVARGGAPSVAVPGYSAVWDIRETADQVEVFAPLGTSRGTRDGVTDVVASDSSPTLLPMRWVIRPDDPDTAADEYEVSLFADEVLGALYSCSGAACPTRFEPGDELVAYYGGAIIEYDATRVDSFQVLDFWNVDAPGRTVVTADRVCAP